MIVSPTRLDHLKFITGSEKQYSQGLIFSNDPQISSGFKRLAFERHLHIDLEIIRRIVERESGIRPDEIVAYKDQFIPLKNDQVLALPEAICRRIEEIDLKVYQGWFLVSQGPLAILAWARLGRPEGIKIDGQNVLTKDPLLKSELARATKGLSESGWEYFNRIEIYQDLTQEFLQAWSLSTKTVAVGTGLYSFVQATERFFHGSLETWIQQSLASIINNNLPRVYFFDYPHRGNLASPDLPVLKYSAIKAFSHLVEETPLLAELYSGVQVHSDFTVEIPLFTYKQYLKFKKVFQSLDLSRKSFQVRPVSSFLEGVLSRELYPRLTLVKIETQNYLVGEGTPDDFNKDWSIPRERLRKRCLEFYSFCNPSLDPKMPLEDLLRIVPNFTSSDPLSAICHPKRRFEGSQNHISQFIFHTIEYAWRGYYTYILQGLVNFVPAPIPIKLPFEKIEVGDLSLISINVQGVGFVLSDLDPDLWNNEKYLQLWARFFLRTKGQYSSVLKIKNARGEMKLALND